LAKAQLEHIQVKEAIDSYINIIINAVYTMYKFTDLEYLRLMTQRTFQITCLVIQSMK
jgi:hypothetical protein